MPVYFESSELNYLRLLDNTVNGIKHGDVRCDECDQIPILGMRWKCFDCSNYDLCSKCYHGDAHSLEHRFYRITTPLSPKQLMDPRKTSKRLLTPDEPFSSVYRDHLPFFGRDGIEERAVVFKYGDRVMVKLEREDVEKIQKRHGEWSESMVEILTKTGFVAIITDSCNVSVSYSSGNQWSLNPAILTLVPTPRMFVNAARYKNSSRLRELLDYQNTGNIKPDVNWWFDGLSALQVACQMDNFNTVDLLLRHNVSPINVSVLAIF